MTGNRLVPVLYILILCFFNISAGVNKPRRQRLSFGPAHRITSRKPAAAPVMINPNVSSNSFTATNNAIALPAAPKITYQTPQTYYVNTTIAPLAPTNTGGAVPPNIYGDVTAFAGSGSAGSANGAVAAASFNGPVSVAFDASGNLFVSETVNNDIREITPAG